MENVLATTSTVKLETTKPLVKDYFDRDAAIRDYLSTHLREPLRYDKVDYVKLYLKKDGVTYKYRVNWHVADGVTSAYVEVRTDEEGRVLDHNLLSTN